LRLNRALLHETRRLLKTAAGLVTRKVAPQTAKKIRSAIHSLDGAVRNIDRWIPTLEREQRDVIARKPRRITPE
jgi:hypothetical protein